ncbi:MAG: collagen-like protein, partial [Lachnospiraceae bacterium]|nr:collagen-like protein [Lachnospiraceae bacterium]
GSQGEKGEKGETGAQGEKGEKGETGAQGEKGDKGDKGEPGRNGADGRDGKDGLNGRDGLNGKDGIDGKNGADGKDGLNGKDGKDGVDGVGVTNVTIMDGNLIITLSDGKVINAGRIPVENHVTIPSGDAKSFYFNTSGSDITKVTINGREIEKGSYEVETYGEGALVTIEEETIPLSGAEIKVETTTGTETVKVQPQNNSNNNSKNSNNNTGNSVPWWVIYILIGLNVLTGGVAVLALAKKNK